jgi:ribosome maturation factor RimP
LRFAYDGRRNFKGRLVGVDGDEIVLVVADTEYLFPVEGIDKANVVPRF